MNYERPKFSIIVPTFARPDRLSACLNALARQEFPRHRFEVIVADDGSSTSLEGPVTAFQDCLTVTLLRQPHAGPATARNTGAKQARGEFLAFTDDDCEPASDWLRSLEARFVITPDCAIAGKTLNGLPGNLYSGTSQMLIDYLYAYYNADPNDAVFSTSNNLAVPAVQFHAIGGFDTSFARAAAEDREFCQRWKRSSYRIVYAPEVRVSHNHHMTLRSFWRQHFAYGQGAFRFHTVRARRDRERIKLEPLSFYVNLLCRPFSQTRGVLTLLMAALLGVSQAANVAGFLWEMLKQTTSKFLSKGRASTGVST